MSELDAIAYRSFSDRIAQSMPIVNTMLMWQRPFRDALESELYVLETRLKEYKSRVIWMRAHLSYGSRTSFNRNPDR